MDNTGVKTLALRDGDRTVDTRAQTCDLRHLQPCPLAVTAPLATDLPDGVHTLTAVATDAGGETRTSGPATFKLDRTAPGAPLDVKLERRQDGTYAYTWRNPDQGQMAPIAAVHVSDGTVVRGANLERVEVSDPETTIWLEDEAGNADPATA